MTITKVNWDSTNIGENYPGITLPLTYSFIKDAYANVYENYLKLIGVRKELIENNRNIMRNMLGYVKGHVFYNIDNWYRFLTFMPGYNYNKKFFEAMLDPAEKKKQEDGTLQIYLNRIDSLKVLLKFVYLLFFSGSLHNKFEKEFQKLHQKYTSHKLSNLDNFALTSLFEYLQDNFFSIWSITIVNDFKVMIFFGLLNKLAEKFKNEKDDILRDIYSAKKQPGSITLINRIIDIAYKIKKNKRIIELFTRNEYEILELLNNTRYKAIKTDIEIYLKEFGERSSNELKLEEPKFKEKPELFISLIKNYVLKSSYELKSLSKLNRDKASWYQPKSGSLINKCILKILKDITVKGIYQREYYRIKRGKAFNLAREIFLEMGKRMVYENDLNDINDIFYLYKHEVIDYFNYNALKNDFRSIIQFRKSMFDRYKFESVSRRIITEGLPGREKVIEKGDKTTHILEGQGTSKGKVKGKAIVMETLNFNDDYTDKILITGATDPGWTVIFPLLKGVITERGGLLSHASIIARELGIPCVVKVDDATKLIKSGQSVEIDGIKGYVKILN